MNNAQVATVHRHLAAVSKLILGDKRMGPSLVVLAGEELSPLSQLEQCRASVESRIDVIYLSFAIDDAGDAVMTDITVFLPRDKACYTSIGCRLALLPGHARAVLEPQANVPGHFRILPGEIVLVNSKPKALARGAERAAQRLAALMRDGVDLTGQVDLNAFVDA